MNSKTHGPRLPVALTCEERSSFGIRWYGSEADAMKVDKHVRKLGITVNGGWLHGKACGRAPQFDHFSVALNRQLFAVTY